MRTEGKEKMTQVVFIPGPPSNPRASGYYDYRLLVDGRVQCSKRGRKTNVYVLEWFGNSWACSCMGHSVRRECKHAQYCPFRGSRPEEKKASLGILADAAKRAFITLRNGRRVNCYDHFWTASTDAGAKGGD